ncbi:glycosyltransferase [Streptomyces sp. N2-109]|uniref:Glycosyltransferase n=1 Tax=Streptomyces gossypii TaxID=2883101 RepID=A0ABT2JX09_9ACTN|nr:glycosyltransferase [Streptomyces gossypii]MCT2592416.1 glycosyltransferase [Streptomyces gossypii]
MSRILFVVPPLAGHVNPAAAVAAELEARGHQVAWAGQPAALARCLGPGARVYFCAGPTGARPDVRPGDRPGEPRGAAALKDLWEEFFAPLAVAMAPGVTAAVLEFFPDFLVVDQQTVAGALVAERLRVPFVTSCTTSAELAGSLTGVPKVADGIARLLGGLRQRLGDPSARYDPRFSPLLTLVFSTPEITGAHALPVTPLRFLGPAVGPRPGAPDFPWEWLDRGSGHGRERLALVTLGTAGSTAGAPFLQACVTAVRARRGEVRAVVVDPAGVLGDAAAAAAEDPDVLVRASVPQLALLERARAVICHGGHHTVTEALWHGVPLVVAPVRDDQPVVAAQVTAAGVGVRVRFRRADPVRVGSALDAVLEKPGYAAAARRVRTAFRAAGGAAAAAAQLDELAIEEDDFPWHSRAARPAT